MQSLYAYVTAHWATIMVVAGVWTLPATFLASRWPRPASSAPWWKKLLHLLLVDGPSWVAAQNGKTWMGLKVSIPYVTWTTAPSSDYKEEPKGAARTKQGGFVSLVLILGLALIGLAMAFSMAGCAPGTDGLRQACATEERTLAGGYESAAAWYRAKLEAAKTLSSSDPKAAVSKIDAASSYYNKAISAFDAGGAAAKTQCSLADAIDAGEKHDVKALISQVGAITSNVGQILASLPGAL